MKSIKKIPFEFVLEKLISADPYVRPMFGAYGVYVGEKIVLILRDKESYSEDNGVWVATSSEYHESLRKNFPLQSIKVFGPGETSWQVLQKDHPQFEEKTIELCELILNNDERIGRIPKKKKKPVK